MPRASHHHNPPSTPAEGLRPASTAAAAEHMPVVCSNSYFGSASFAVPVFWGYRPKATPTLDDAEKISHDDDDGDDGGGDCGYYMRARPGCGVPMTARQTDTEAHDSAGAFCSAYLHYMPSPPSQNQTDMMSREPFENATILIVTVSVDPQNALLNAVYPSGPFSARSNSPSLNILSRNRTRNKIGQTRGRKCVRVRA